MANEFYTILTQTGQSKLSAAILSNTPLELATMALGDGLNGAGYSPTDTQTALKHEVYSAPINAVYPDPTNPVHLIVEMVVPDTAGGWTVREAMVKDASGAAFAVANFPDTYKPQMASGSNKQLHVKMVLAVATPAAITLSVDATAVYATRDYLASVVLPFVTQTKLSDALTPFLTKSAYSADQTALGQTLGTFITGTQLSAALQGYATTTALNNAIKDFITSSGVDAKLNGYATTNALNQALQSYITSTALNTALQAYTNTTSLNLVLQSYVTGTGLTTALQSYATTNAMNIAMQAQKTELLAGPTFAASPLAPTPAQFDNSKKLATTEFIRGVGFSFSTARFISATTTLTPADIGALLVVSGNTGPITITLPPTTTLPLGSPLFIFNGSGYPVTIVPSGGNIVAGGVNQTGVILGVNDDAVVATIATGINAKWQLVGGALVSMYSGQFKYQASAAGFQMFPGGIIRQWGNGITSTGGSGDVTFPIAYTATVYSASAFPTTKTSDAWTRSMQWANDAYVGSLTTTRFLMRRDASKLCSGSFTYEVLGK